AARVRTYVRGVDPIRTVSRHKQARVLVQLGKRGGRVDRVQGRSRAAVNGTARRQDRDWTARLDNAQSTHRPSIENARQHRVFGREPMACADRERYVVVELEGMRQVIVGASALHRRAGVVDLRIESSKGVRVGKRLAEGVVGLELESVASA